MKSFDMTKEQEMIVDALSRFAIKEMCEATRECDETGKVNKLILTRCILGFRSTQLK